MPDLVGDYVSVPREIWEDRSLTLYEQHALAKIIELHKLNHCFIENTTLGEFLHVTRGYASKIISSLKKKGYIKIKLEREGGTQAVTKRTIIPKKLSENSPPEGDSYRNHVIPTGTGGDSYSNGGDSCGVRVITKVITKEKGLVTGLHQRIVDSCYAIHGEFADYKKEGKSASLLLQKAERFAKLYAMETAVWLKEYVNRAHRLWKSDEFWQKQPFSPTLLNTSSFFDKVIMKAREQADPGLEELAKGLFK